MEIIQHIIDIEIEYIDKLSANNICFLDIETTGLNRRKDLVYLVGLVYYSQNHNSYVMDQLFIDNLDKENLLLKELNNLLKKFQTIITFNGVNFDLPFIKHRMKVYNIDISFINIFSFDIYKEVRGENSYLNFPSLKLKILEKILGIIREDEYSGKDCIRFYFEFIKTRNYRLKEKILKHNYDDLYYLPQVLEIFDIIEEKKSLYLELQGEKIRITIENMSFKGDIFTINATTDRTIERYDLYHYGHLNIYWTSKGKLKMKFEAKRGYITPSRKAIFVDINNLISLGKLKDMSEYMTPRGVLLLKVQNVFEMDNIKNIIKEALSVFVH